MATKKSPPTDLDRLALYRLQRGLTFDALAAAMRRAKCPVPARALHRILTHRFRTQPRELTRYQISQFVATLPPPRKPRRRRAAA
jgi:hypothetical protein